MLNNLPCSDAWEVYSGHIALPAEKRGFQCLAEIG